MIHSLGTNAVQGNCEGNLVLRDDPILLATDTHVPSAEKQSLNTTHHVSSWQERGEYHFTRKEWDLACESYTKGLIAEEKNQNTRAIADMIKAIGNVMMEKEQWTLSAKILNAALKLYESIEDQIGKRIAIDLITRLEQRFLKKECNVQSLPDYSEIHLRHQAKLKALRETIESQMLRNHPSQEILSSFSKSIILLFKEMIDEILPFLGTPPCSYTFISLGSLSREEMSPYSDLEFAILVESSENMEYFRHLVKWLEIRTICLGETEIKILERGYTSPVRRGFSFDDGGNTPLGKQGYIELIQTPQNLAKCQENRFYEEDFILSNVLRSTGLLVGDVTLHQNYLDASKSILSSPARDPSLKICQERAFTIIKGHLKEFAPELGQRKEENPIFNIKTELYRLPNFLISAVADYFGIRALNTWAKLTELAEQKILSDEAVENLKKMFTDVMDLRVKCHIFYKGECDDAYHPSMEFKVSAEERLKGVFILTDSDMKKIVRVYQVLFPLFQAFEQAYKDRDFSILSEKNFFDSSLLAQAEAYGRMRSYEAAVDCYKKALALDPDNTQTAFMLTKILLISAQYVEAENYAEKTNLLAKAQNDQTRVSWSLNLQGLIAKDLAKWNQAIEFFTAGLEVAKQRKDEMMESVLLSNLGQVWGALGQHRKAIEFSESAASYTMKIYGKESPDLIEIYINLGASWFFLENFKKAIEYYEIALAILKQNKILEESEATGTLFNNLADAWSSLGDSNKGLNYAKEALRIDEKIFGPLHPNIARNFSNLGKAFETSGNLQEALVCFAKAEEIETKIFGKLSANKPTYLKNIASLLRNQGKLQKALEYNLEALEISRKVYVGQNSKVAEQLSSLGLAWSSLKETEKALKCYDEGLSIVRNCGENHPVTAIILSNKGVCLNESGQPALAIECFTEALRIERLIYGNDDHHSAVTLNNLALAYHARKQYSESIATFEEALRIKRKVFGNDHLSISTTLANLAKVFEKREELAKMIEALEEAVRIEKLVYKGNHPNLAQYAGILNTLGNGYVQTRQFHKALSCYEESIAALEKLHGKQHPLIALSLTTLGAAWYYCGNTKKSMDYTKSAYEMSKRLLGENDPQTKQCYESYVNAKDAFEDGFIYEEPKASLLVDLSKKSMENAQSIYETHLKHFGKDHHITQQCYESYIEAKQAYDEELFYEKTQNQVTFFQAPDREKVELRSFSSQGERAPLMSNNEEDCCPCVIT